MWWDQYGCGRNYAGNVDDNITVQVFAEMTVDLVDEIHRMFPNRAIVLMVIHLEAIWLYMRQKKDLRS